VVQTRKNIAAIVQAMKPLRDYHLVLTGGEGYGADQIKECIRREGMQDRVHSLAYVNRDTLRRLSSGALAFVFPSLAETFGMPILEAMSYGVPVITSNVSAMPEVAGEAAILVDPRNIASIREAMQRLAEDEDIAQLLRQKGVERARQFSWSLCAQRTWQVYLEALEERR
jgi:glycosyltransferase involved in cell wall biosynthesis